MRTKLRNFIFITNLISGFIAFFTAMLLFYSELGVYFSDVVNQYSPQFVGVEIYKLIAKAMLVVSCIIILGSFILFKKGKEISLRLFMLFNFSIIVLSIFAATLITFYTINHI